MTVALVDEANIRLYRELAGIKANLDIYRILGLNSGAIKKSVGKEFFAFVQAQSLKAVLLGLSKVFENNGRYKLCSLSGIYDLAKGIDIANPNVVCQFVEAYGVAHSADWKVDVEKVLSEQRQKFQPEIDRLKDLRDQKFAHMDQAAADSNIGPSYDSLEKMILFADAFHSFVHEAFIGGYASPVAEYMNMENSLVRLLKEVGVKDPALVLK